MPHSESNDRDRILHLRKSARDNLHDALNAMDGDEYDEALSFLDDARVNLERLAEANSDAFR